MNGLTNDSITIDTNVFEQLMNDAVNVDRHIDKLLGILMEDGICLCVDETNFINTQYLKRLEPIIQNRDDTGTRLQILRYWMNQDNRTLVAVNRRSILFNKIKAIVIEDIFDRIFVAVGFTKGVNLITNDKMHILEGPPRETGGRRSNRRTRLLRNTRSLRAPDADLMDSLTACNTL